MSKKLDKDPNIKKHHKPEKENHINKHDKPLFPKQFMHLQRTIGNQAIENNIIQKKLGMSTPGDKYEVEADQVADKIMTMQNPLIQNKTEDEEELMSKPLVNSITPLIQKQSSLEEEELATKLQRNIVEEDEEKKLQTKSNGNNNTVSGNVESGINNLKGGGKPLSPSARNFFEPRFGTDFSHVRVHDTPKAAQLSRAVNARAFTVGSDIAFNTGEFSETSEKGKKLMAHELTHVMQQGGEVRRKSIFDKERKWNRFSAIDEIASRMTATQSAIGLALSEVKSEFKDILSFNKNVAEFALEVILGFFSPGLGKFLNHLKKFKKFQSFISPTMNIFTKSARLLIKKYGGSFKNTEEFLAYYSYSLQSGIQNFRSQLHKIKSSKDIYSIPMKSLLNLLKEYSVETSNRKKFKKILIQKAIEYKKQIQPIGSIEYSTIALIKHVKYAVKIKNLKGLKKMALIEESETFPSVSPYRFITFISPELEKLAEEKTKKIKRQKKIMELKKNEIRDCPNF